MEDATDAFSRPGPYSVRGCFAPSFRTSYSVPDDEPRTTHHGLRTADYGLRGEAQDIVGGKAQDIVGS